MVLAGPGSGKTFVTVHRIHHLITHCHVDPSHILVITFTKAAALEMQERFYRLMKPETPSVWFGTFHAVFYYILKQSAQYRDYTIITESEQKKLLRDIVRMQKQFSYVREEDCAKLLSVISSLKNRAVPFEEEQLRSVVQSSDLPLTEMSADDLIFLALTYQNYLTEFSQLDFDDMIRCCETLLTTNAGILGHWQSQFRYILVDEFQDIAPAQYRLVRLLAGPENNLFIVGDDDQSIYSFRGASPASMQQFLKDYPQTEQILLNVNYRCHRQIVDASLMVVSENKERFSKEIEAFHEEGAGICCQIFDTEKEEQEALANSLQEVLQKDALSDTAMICRTNLDCALWAQVLEQYQIPYHMKNVPKSRFDHFVVRDLMTYLALGDGLRRRNLFLRIMNRPVRYLRRDSLVEEEITEQGWKSYYEDTPALQEAINSLFRSVETLHGRKPYLAVRYIRNVIGYDGYLTEKYGIHQAKEFLQAADEFQEFVRQFPSYDALQSYQREYEEMLKRQREAGRGKAAEEKQGIEVLTMHASKGLEYDNVFLPGCMEGTIPIKKAKSNAEIEEERRMFYVAMTRAKKRLCISAHKEETGKAAPSRFLRSICPETD
jgi:DNA helicase-2/ATP-dependent DNA helicase PcrA